MASLVILESDAGELVKIDKRLEKDGFKTTLSVEHKLRYIWRQLLRSETSLASSLESVEELRKQHAQEMIEVETYVDHIRQLSTEREALTVDLEVENEKLKAGLEELREEQDRTCFSMKELQVMLRDSNVPEGMFKDKNSIKDHLGTLVRDHKHVLDKIKHLEAERAILKANNGSDSTTVSLLEQERDEMENEMKRMQDNMKLIKQEERRMHEKEVDDVKKEKQELQKKLNMLEKKCKELQVEVLDLKRNMEEEQRAHNKDMTEMIRKQQQSDNRSGLDKLHGRTTGDEYNKRLSKAVEEMEQVNGKLKEVEKQKTELQEAVSLLENVVAIEREAVSGQSGKQGGHANTRELQKELDVSKQKYMELQIKLGKMETEKKHVDAQLLETQIDLEHLQKFTSEREKNLTDEQSSALSYQNQIQELTQSYKNVSLQLKAANDTINEQRNEIEQITVQLAKTEKTLELKEQDFEANEKDLKNEINQMKQQLSLSATEANNIRNELTRTKDEYDQVVLKIKQEAEQIQEKYHEETDKTKSTSDEVLSLRAQVSELKKDLEASLSASMSREHETSGHVETLEKTRDELVAELNRCIGQGKTQKGDIESLNSRTRLLEQEKSSLQSIVLSQERKVAEIHDKLQITERQLAEQQGVLSYEKTRSTDTTQKFEITLENLTNVRQECDTLREELRVLSEKLLKQHDAALESQSKYDSLITQLRNEMQHERETYAVERHKLGSQLEQAVKESKEFSLLLKQREEELNRLQSDFNTTSRTSTKTSTALEFETRLRETLEHKNSTLETELTKSWTQTKSVMERLATLEADKGQLERDLERRCQLYHITEESLQKKDADVVGLTVAKDTAEQRAESAEVKLMSLEREKDNVQRELERTQSELGEAYRTKAELELKKEESHTLKIQLDDEEQNRSLHRQTIDELKRQVDMLHDRERVAYDKVDELQATVRDYEAKFETLQNQFRTVSDNHKSVEQEGLSALGKLQQLRSEKDQLQVDLVVAAERIEYLESKCNRRKMKAIHKIQTIKERYEREKRTSEATVRSLQNTLELSKKKIRKEEEWKQTTDSERKQLVEEKQDLLTRLTQGEEVIREHLRNLRDAETRLTSMEKDGLEMRDKINILTRQNEHLERLNKILEKPENQSRSPFNTSINNQSLYDALNRIRLNESLNSTDYSPKVSLTALSPSKSASSLNGSYIGSSPSSGTLLVN